MSLIATKLRKMVDEYATEAFTHNPLFKKLKGPGITPIELANWLFNIQYLVYITPIHLQEAIAACNKMGLESLEKFYRTKLREEAGHHAWAENDIKKIRSHFPEVPKNLYIKNSIVDLVDHSHNLIKKDPALYLSHIFFAEYFTVIGTDVVAKGLRENSKIPEGCITIFTNHAELDQDHVREWEMTIPKLIENESLVVKSLEKALATDLNLYTQFCNELVGIKKPILAVTCPTRSEEI